MGRERGNETTQELQNDCLYFFNQNNFFKKVVTSGA
jgi:hypothetical protein